MGIRAITTYPFETEWLIGEIRCHDVHKPGVIYLVHKGDPKLAYTPGYDLLPEVPRQALLMPEWLATSRTTRGWRTSRLHLQRRLGRGRPFTGRARLVVRNVGPFPPAVGEIDAMWREFERTL